MATPRKSVAKLRADGSRHYSQAELQEREEREPKVPDDISALPPSSIPAPEWLPELLRKRFDELAAILESMGLLTILDADALGRYLIAESSYRWATAHMTKALQAGNAEEAQKWSSMQARFFSQCRNIGNDLGLSVSGRCRLEVPTVPPPSSADPDADLYG